MCFKMSAITIVEEIALYSELSLYLEKKCLHIYFLSVEICIERALCIAHMKETTLMEFVL